jgi:short-subunit dehydrogenase
MVTTNLSLDALNKMQHQGFGTIINIGSSASFQPLPYMAVYAASKAYLKIFSLSLIGEVRTLMVKSIQIHHINPSGTLTNFQSNAGVKVNKGEKLLSSQETGLRIIELVFSGKTYATIGRNGKLMELLSKVIPINFQVKLWSKLMEKLR